MAIWMKPMKPTSRNQIIQHFKIIVAAILLPLSINESRVYIAAKIAMPFSKRTLEMNNTDPRLNPSVKFNYLKNENDIGPKKK